MRIKNLKVVNLRAFEQAEFEFTAGMNLLVGVNGVGKTTVLDSIRICLSKIIPDITASRSRKESFDKEDIRIKSKFMTVNCTFELQDKEFTFIVHKNLESNIPRESNDPREQVWETPDKESYNPPLPDSFYNIKNNFKKASSNPLGLFFSTRRSLVSDAIASNKKAVGGQAGAYAEALVSRELRLAEIAHWMRAQEKLGKDRPLGLKHLSALQKATEHFMPECKNFRADTESKKPRLIVDKAGMTLDLHQLSDGERGMFALVLELVWKFEIL
jgi:predicted ATP-binding protein involved in virulence